MDTGIVIYRSKYGSAKKPANKSQVLLSRI